MRPMMLVVMLAVLLGANFYVFYRLWMMIPAGSILRPALLVFAVVAVGSFFLGMLAGGKLPIPVTRFIYALGTSWFFIMLYFLMTFLVLDIVRLTRLLPLNQWMFGSWAGLAVVVGFVTVIMTGGYIHYRNKVRIDLPVVTSKMTVGDQPIKIVALSDLHLGYTIGKKEFEKWVELINREEPDVVLLAGDVIDNGLRPVIEGGYAKSFHKIKSRYGVFAAPGNHEYISGLDQSLAFLREAGVTVLQDSVALVDGRFYVVGRDDRSNPRRKALETLTDDLDRSKPVIVLDHQPYHLEEAEQSGVDLQISGHTHRGQVWPINWIVDGMYEKAYGYLKKGDTNYYVSSGMGIWGGKFRIGSRSEYMVITLTAPR